MARVYARRGAPLLERLMFRVVKTPTCWNWTGTKIPRGYGMLGDRGRSVLAHRASYEAHVGPIPDGLCVLHICDNRLCVRPDHLFLGRDLENARDREAKGRGRQPKGRHSGRAKLDDEEVLQIRASKATPSTLADVFGVTNSTICKIQKRQSWTHL